MQSAVGEDFLPGFLYSVQPNQTQAAWVNADDFFLIGPNLHQSGQISALERIVKSEFGFFGCGKHHRHDWVALVAVNNGARCELVVCAAVGTACLTGLGDIQKYARMHAPERRLGAGAVNRQVGGFDLHRSNGLARTTGNCVSHDYSRE